MTILPEEAVKAAARELCRFGTSFSTIDATKSWVDEKWPRFKEEATRALTAALPFLPVQGAVKKLAWTKGVVDIAQPMPGMKYVACNTTPKGSWAWWLDNAPETRGVFTSEEAAKAAAQADYEARILSAIEAASPLSKLKAENARLKARLAEALKALGMMLREHDILSGNFGDVMDPKHRRPDRWPTAAEAARRVLEGCEGND
jgi:hypothetical protein